MVIQTLLFIGAAVGGLRRLAPNGCGAWRKRRPAAEAQVAELRVHLDRMAATVDDTARALRRGTERGRRRDDRRARCDGHGQEFGGLGGVRSSPAPRAALALGLWRGLQSLAQAPRRAARRCGRYFGVVTRRIGKRRRQ